MTIEAMKQVLKAWDAYDGGTLDHPMAAAMEVLRTAIEQAEKPVAWGDVKIRPDGKRYCRAVYTTDLSNAGCLPLYTTPPAATTKKEKE
jgi:hypothetical protein